MKNVSKGTIIRTATLLIALVNQVLVLYGKSPLPISDEVMEQFISTGFTIISSMVAWFGNNYVTKKGKEQRDVLKQHGLSK
ncbi:phage holin [Paraliobacillus quinghaiensis]|uniref:phage holin n=1 Tax=Paraliobacillus quinghaiensis TaxID=470815 RepID=UPI000E3C66E5|nr:phage holin [Paraliobacillus quinghaiensis]